MANEVPRLLVNDADETVSLTKGDPNGAELKINKKSKREKGHRSSINSRRSAGRLSNSSSPSFRGNATKHATGETDSIGSAGSIMFGGKTSSGSSRFTSPSLGRSSVDLDDEILVGDEREFHDACRCGDLATVEYLVKSGIDVNCRNKHDRTPLHWTSGNGHLDILKILLDEGGTIDAADKFGMDALLWAAWFGHKESVQHMMHAGAKSTARNKHGYTWLHCAAQNNHISVIEILTEEMQDFDKDILDDNGRSCLHAACKYGRVDLAKRLLELGCNVKLKDKQGNTPLHVSAKYGFPGLISVLVNAQCDLDDTNNNQQTALHVAAGDGKAAFCEELLQHDIDVNPETEDEICPLHLAVIGGHAQATMVLLQHEADVDAGNKHNQTPLHFAVMGSNLEITKLLVKYGANSSVIDARNETPLHLAAENGLYDITEVLLLANSNHNIKDAKGKTPLDVAARGNYVMIVDMIIKAERYRYYLMSEHPDGENNVMTKVTFKPDKNSNTQHFRTLLYSLASKHLKPIEWKQLAFYWGFTDRQLQAIEEQYTGNKSYKEHGHRMLLIWFHGCVTRKQNPIKSLYEGLAGIQRRDLAELMRTKTSQVPDGKSCSIS